MRIEAYTFGSITIDGKTYTSDLKIIGNRIVPNWWRKEGHRLNLEDITDIIEAKPDVLVIGTGYSGLMVVPEKLKATLRTMGIDVIVQPTSEAYKTFNQLEGRNASFAAHLTC